MRIPDAGRTLDEIIEDLHDPDRARRFGEIVATAIDSAPKARYLHWDQLRHRKPPEGLSAEEWWIAVKLARSLTRRGTPILDGRHRPFWYSTPDLLLQLLHEVDRDASGRIGVSDAIVNTQTRDRYIQSSLIEEAITSSQLEGAAVTREDAKQMIRSGRKPRGRGEQMIINNYHAMQFITQIKGEPLTWDLVMKIHHIITERTLSPHAEEPYLRRPNDGVAVYDDRDNTLLHLPPPAEEIESRMAAMCDFANQSQEGAFLHPVVKAILLHFWLAYDHPFIDGNGRTARALFYWSMLKQGYWLAEFLSISSVIRRSPVKYSRSFLYTETDENDLTYFLEAQLRVICRAIEELKRFLERKVAEINATERRLRDASHINYRQLALLSHVLRHPGMFYSIESHRISHGVTYQTARTDLLELESRGLLVKSKRGRRFLFQAATDLDNKLQAI